MSRLQTVVVGACAVAFLIDAWLTNRWLRTSKRYLDEMDAQSKAISDQIREARADTKSQIAAALRGEGAAPR